MARCDYSETTGVHWRIGSGRCLFAGLVDHSEKGRESMESWPIGSVSVCCGPVHPVVRMFEPHAPIVKK